MTVDFTIQTLSSQHQRQAFASGSDALDRYLREQAGQDARRRVSNCYVAVPSGMTAVAGYYTLAAASIPAIDLDEPERKRLPRYPVLPTALIGRLAVDRRYHGKRLGSALLYDALARSLHAEAAVYAVIVHAKDDAAAAFYRHFGFRRFASRARDLFLPVATVAKRLRG